MTTDSLLDPEELESAEVNGFYTTTKNYPSRLNLTRKAKREQPNGYTLINEFSDQFTLTENGILSPKPNDGIIYEKVIEYGHTVGDGPDQSTYPVTLEVRVTGSLTISEDQTVVDGDMNIEYSYYSL